MRTQALLVAAQVWVGFVWLGCCAGTSVVAEERPNVLLIAIDDLNDWVGVLDEHPQVQTPHIDRLARRGTLFRNAHCQAPICGPSRASLLGGRYPHQNGVYQQPTRTIASDAQMYSQFLPLYFARHGYRTLGVGKITHGFNHEDLFDEYGSRFSGSGPKPPNNRRFHFRPPETPWTGTQTDWGIYPEHDSEMTDYKAASWAVQRLEKLEDEQQPFFMAVGFVRPHVPFYTPSQWFEMYPRDSVQLPAIRRDDLQDVPAIGRAMHELPNYPDLAFLSRNDNEQFRRCVQAYLACITFVDHQVGRVLDALDASPFADNTIVVLFSDHGYHLGEKDRVSKHTLWEESTRVPLIVVRPGSAAQASDADTIDRNVGLIDLYPTLVDLAGLPPQPRCSGQSLLPLMADPSAAWREATLTTYARGNHALRSDDFRYIRYEDGSEELYDHRKDPHEWKNLADDPANVPRLRRFRSQLPRDNAPYHPATSPAPINAWFKEHYQSSGVGRP